MGQFVCGFATCPLVGLSGVVHPETSPIAREAGGGGGLFRSFTFLVSFSCPPGTG